MKKDVHSIVAEVQRTLRQNQKIFLTMSVLFLMLIGYFLWNLKEIERENIEIKELAYQLEIDNLYEQNSVFKLCLASDEQSREKYSAQSDSYDMKIQNDIRLLRELLPEEKETYAQIQETLQSALSDRQLAIANGSSRENGQKALELLEKEYAPKMQSISQLCGNLSQRVTQISQKRIFQAQLIVFASILLILWTTVFLIFVSNRQKKRIEKLISVPVKEILVAMEELEKGNLGYESSYQSDNEMGILMDRVRRSMRILQGYVSNVEQVLYSLS